MITYKRGLGYQDPTRYVHMAVCFRCGVRNTAAGTTAGICDECGYRANDDFELFALLEESNGDINFQSTYDATGEFEFGVKRRLSELLVNNDASRFNNSSDNTKDDSDNTSDDKEDMDG